MSFDPRHDEARRPVRTRVKSVPATAPSVFGGTGMFAAWDPRSALRLKGLVDWIAVQAEGQTDGKRWTTPETVAELKAAGFVVHVWEAAVSEGGRAVDRLGATGYIGQAESQPQHDACLALPKMACPKAIVSNVTYLPVGLKSWPKGWDCLAEAYWNVNPNATPDVMVWEAGRRGAGADRPSVVAPVFGLYDGTSEGGGRRSLAEYRSRWPSKPWCGYLAEGLTDADVAFLQGRH